MKTHTHTHTHTQSVEHVCEPVVPRCLLISLWRAAAKLSRSKQTGPQLTVWPPPPVMTHSGPLRAPNTTGSRSRDCARAPCPDDVWRDVGGGYRSGSAARRRYSSPSLPPRPPTPPTHPAALTVHRQSRASPYRAALCRHPYLPARSGSPPAPTPSLPPSLPPSQFMHTPSLAAPRCALP